VISSLYRFPGNAEELPEVEANIDEILAVVDEDHGEAYGDELEE
jgi:hypothetical protein